MKETDKLNIGIITASASDMEQKQQLSGIIEAAQELDANVFVFSNIYNSQKYYADVEIENNIYDLILSHRIDALVLTAECIMNNELQQSIYNSIVSRSDIPVVVTGAEIPGLTCINTDVEEDIYNMIRHLTDVHGFTEIDLLTGPEKWSTSHERVNGYRRAIEQAGIRFSEERVIFGDFWLGSGTALANEYISGKRPLPQAVACANDYMAYGLCDTLLPSDIRVPDKLAVTGYEYSGNRIYHAPILTTFQRNRAALGKRAVYMLVNQLRGSDHPLPDLGGYIIKGDSCSCGSDNTELCKELGSVRNNEFYKSLNLTGNFEQQLAKCRSVTEYVGVIQEFLYLIRDIKGLYLCLYDNWCSSGDFDSDIMQMYQLLAPEPFSTAPVSFRKNELFSDIIPAIDGRRILYFCPLFFSGRSFGHLILQYDSPDGYDPVFRDWLKIAANALEQLRMKNDISYLLECRNLSIMHDSVTGLLNEIGLLSETELLSSGSSSESITVILIKTNIYSEGMSISNSELSIRTDCETADNIRSFSHSRSDICARIGDGVYVFVTAEPMTDESISIMTDKMKAKIGNSPLYSHTCGFNSVIIRHRICSADGFQLSDVLKELRSSINDEICRKTVKRSNAAFGGYASVRNKIYSSPEKSWTAEEFCREMNHSSGYFRSTYKDLFGISFHQDLIQSRITHAKYLLLTTPMSLSAIAYKCGYDDEKYFFRQFRQMTSMTPNQYKTQ